MDGNLQQKLMLSVSINYFIFLFISSKMGIPISSSMTVVAILIGTGLTQASLVIDFSKLSEIITSWILFPSFGLTFSLLMIMFINKFTLYEKSSLTFSERRKKFRVKI